jgi:hypothetical protein
MFGIVSYVILPFHRSYVSNSFLYLHKQALCSLQVLECLVQLASVRRSIFVEDPARLQFLSHLMSGTKEILLTGQGLLHSKSYY